MTRVIYNSHVISMKGRELYSYMVSRDLGFFPTSFSNFSLFSLLRVPEPSQPRVSSYTASSRFTKEPFRYGSRHNQY